MSSRKAPRQKSEIESSEASQRSSGRPLRKASQKCLEMFNKASWNRSEKSSRKSSQKGLKILPKEAPQKSFQKPSKKAPQKNLEILPNEAPQKSLRKPSKKAPQKNLKILPNEAPEKSLQKPSRKAPRKSPQSKTKTEILASEKNLKSNSKPVIHRQSAFCIICKKSFTGKKKLKDHNTKHHYFRHCPNCPRTFQQTRKFILHLRSHLEDHPYECKICLVCFNKKVDLLAHKKEHKNPRTLQCDMCPEVFPHIASLNRHILGHTGPPYVCEDCDAVFSNVPDKSVHSQNHVHRCVFCPKEVVAFPSHFGLLSHISTVHPMDPNENQAMDTWEPCVSTGAVNLEEDSGSDSMEDLPSSDDDESDEDVDNNYQKDAVKPVYSLKRKDKFICFMCFDLYPSSELLMSHMKAHKWYPCNSCHRFFADAETLVKHECDFGKVPSFRCEICNTETKCESCKKSYSNRKNGISKAYTNALQIFPELPRVPSNYCDVAERTLLYKFIDRVKSQKEPLDVQSFCHIGLHSKCLEQILENPLVRRLFHEEHIPHIKDLYLKFQNLSETLCNQLNSPFS